MTTFRMEGLEAIEVSQTILTQLTNGGNGAARLQAMVGAHNLTYDRNGSTTFHFKLCKKANMVKITLNDMDLYDITFYRFNKKTLELTEFCAGEDVYAEDLAGIFRSFTGLDTHL